MPEPGSITKSRSADVEFPAEIKGNQPPRIFLKIICRFAGQISPCPWAGNSAHPVKMKDKVMTEQHDKSSAICNPQANAQVAEAQPQIGDRKPIPHCIPGGSSRGAAPRLLLLGLACVATLAAGVNWAAATDQVPYRDAFQVQIVSGDGASDQVYVGQGIATLAGAITTVVQVHIEAAQYDPASNSYLIGFSGTEILTAANGDTLISAITGVSFHPLDSNGNQLPPPYHIAGTQQITGGTGRFAGASGSLTFSGSDHNNGIITVTSQGTVSSVGSIKG